MTGSVYTFNAQLCEQAKKVASAFGDGLSIGWVGISPQLFSRIQEVSSNSKLNVSFHSHVLGLTIHERISLETPIDLATRFSVLSLDIQKVLDFVAAWYEQLPLIAGPFACVANHRRLLIVDRIREGLLLKLKRLLGIRHQIDWVGDNYAVYCIASPKELDRNRQLAGAVLETIKACRRTSWIIPHRRPYVTRPTGSFSGQLGSECERDRQRDDGRHGRGKGVSLRRAAYRDPQPHSIGGGGLAKR